MNEDGWIKSGDYCPKCDIETDIYVSWEHSENTGTIEQYTLKERCPRCNLIVNLDNL